MRIAWAANRGNVSESELLVPENRTGFPETDTAVSNTEKTMSYIEIEVLNRMAVDLSNKH